MKKYLLLFAFLATVFITTAQDKGIVYYGHIESPGKGGSVGLDFNAYLVFNKEVSYYVTAKDSLEDATTLEDQKIKKENGEVTEIYIGKHTLPQGKQVYFDRKEDSLWWNKKYNIPVYGHEKRKIINWKLYTDTKMIGGLKCYKATGTFRGKNYTAWYTKKIPLPYGPWKLQGLPGLILEAYDTNKEMYLYFKSIEYPTKKNIAVTPIFKPKEDALYPWFSIVEYKEFLNKLVEKNKTKAIIIAKQMGGNATVKPGGIETLSVEIFE